HWTLARETYLLMVDRYPAHPLSAEAYRWLIRQNTSGEARRRQELGQFVMLTETGFPSPSLPKTEDGKKDKTDLLKEKQMFHEGTLTLLRDKAESRQWFKGSLELGKRLAAYGPLYAGDPATQLCLQSARQRLGELETAQDWYTKFKTHQTDGPWHDAAVSELWVTRRSGSPPRPFATCRQTAAKPFLDGK